MGQVKGVEKTRLGRLCRALRCALVGGLLSACTALPPQRPPVPAGSAETATPALEVSATQTAAARALQDFGQEKFPPIGRNFFFLGASYLEAPYVFERRGLDIYINGHLLETGPEWPPYDGRVSQDPGEPPPDCSPIAPAPAGTDSRDAYWARKWRYLVSHHPDEEARRLMLELYRHHPLVRAARPDPQYPQRVEVTGKTGPSVSIHLPALIPNPPAPGQFQEALLADARDRLATQADFLQRNILIIAPGAEAPSEARRLFGGIVTFNGVMAREFLEILASERSGQEKIALLIEQGASQEPTDRLHLLAREFKPGRQFVQRVTALVAERHAAREPGPNPAEKAGKGLAELGSEKLEPVDSGFLFKDGVYFDAPYVIERRGTDMYVNGRFFQVGPPWPPYDWGVPVDPGDPPVGHSPLRGVMEGDPRDDYWSRKWRYLTQHQPLAEARQRMIAAYQKSPLVQDVEILAQNLSIVELTGVDGTRVNVSLSGGPAGPPLTKDQVLAPVRANMASLANALRRGSVLFDFGGVVVSSIPTSQGLEILASSRPADEKAKLLEELSMFVSLPEMRRLVRDFRPTPEFRKRIEVLRRAEAEKAAKKAR